MYGVMGEYILVNGATTKCMVMENLNGQMVENTLATISMTRSRVMECLNGVNRLTKCSGWFIVCG